MDREADLARLATDTFDLLVVGGGATGAGAALDAASRGLSVALVERGDLAVGTSSRSTKLIHGGVRYLEMAVKRLDLGQFHLVRDALHERALLLRLAPHLARPLPILTPIYSWFGVPYYSVGLKAYDLLAGRTNLAPSRLFGPGEAARRFPMLRREGLRGAVQYYDGQFDDARMNVALGLTAREQGAAVVTHAEVVGLVKERGRVAGAVVRDRLGGGETTVRARAVLNATGPFADELRRMDDPDAVPMLTASSGVHIVLDARFSPPATGLLIPKTDDGRVLFVLPWLGHTLIGTTDEPAPITSEPRATEAEIAYLLRHVERYFDLPVTEDDVLAAWSGLRPLVSDPAAVDTARLSRDHVVQVSEAGLVTIAGGKWTTYRRMAIDAVDAAARAGGLEPPRPSRTEELPLVGGAAFDPDGAAALAERWGLEPDVAEHLHRAYGDRAARVAELAADGHGARLAPGHPHLEAEVLHGARAEGARRVEDVLSRRTRLAFLDAAAARAAAPRVAALLAAELGWDEARRREELAAAERSLSDALPA